MYLPLGSRRRAQVQAARRSIRGAQKPAPAASLVLRALQQQLAIVGLRPCQQRRSPKLGMACQCRLEVLARLAAPAGACRGASEDALDAAGVPGEAPLNQPLRIRDEVAIQGRAAVRIPEA